MASTSAADVGSIARQGGFGAQFLATMRKNLMQKKREPISCLLETLLPPIFIVGLIAAWSASSITTFPDKMFISQNTSADGTVDFNSLLTTAVCDNATIPLPGLRPCLFFERNASTFGCFNAPNVPYKTICSVLPPIAIAGLYTQNFKTTRYVPTFDEMVVMQWVAETGFPKALKEQYQSIFNSLANLGRVHFVPDSNATRAFANYLNQTTIFFKIVGGRFFSTYDEASEYLLNPVERTWGVVQIPTMSPTELSFTVHLNRSGIVWTNNRRNRFTSGLGQHQSRLYLTSGFLTLQNAVQDYYMSRVLNIALPVRAAITPMPYASYKESEFLSLAGTLAPLIVVLSFLYSVSQLTKRIVEEKENRIREAMMIMGLGTGSFYLSWIATYFLQNLVSSLLMAILLKVTMLPLVNFGVVFFLLLFFSVSTISLAGCMGAFFSKSRVAALLAPVVYFIVAIPSFALPADTSAGIYGLLSILFSPTAFGIGSKLVFQYEITEGFSGGDLANQFDTINMASVFAFLIIDIIWYTLLMLYVDAVFPNEWGTSRHPLFCFIEPYRWWQRRQAGSKNAKEMPDARDPRGAYEQISSAVAPSVRLRGLRKVFELNNEPMIAVNDLTMDFYMNEVTVLLGHNGAGKTTAINIMTGMLEADGGDCTIFGRSVIDDMHAVRQEIGFCPQHNILWPQLTCVEHLEFFAALKGLAGPERDQAVADMLAAVDLTEKANVWSENLSGGQKRKLSVAIAFVGGNRMVFLDEPTAGMDVAARRFTWDLIKKMSVGRTIVLTTHYMDEADLLGNSVAIMAKGRLKCQGSPLFLKSRLGVGYNLTIACTATAPVRDIQNLITGQVPLAENTSHVTGEVTYRLPMVSVPLFPALLSAIEVAGPALGVQSYGMSVTTLEEIFLKIGHDDEVEAHKEDAAVPSHSPTASIEVDMPALDAETRMWTEDETSSAELDVPKQLGCLLTKRFHYAKRDRRTICLQIVTPIVCVLVAMALSTFKFPASPSMIMSNDGYGPIDTAMVNCAPAFNQAIGNISGINVAATPASMTTAFNLSRHLLDTFKTHRYERLNAIACNDATILPRPATVIFTNESLRHSAAIGLWQYAQGHTTSTLGRVVKINVYNEPLRLTGTEAAFVEAISVLIVGIFIMIPFTFIPSTFVSYVVKERECKAKHLQVVSGLNYFVYWTSNFLFDIVCFILTSCFVWLIFAIFDRKEYIGSGEVFGAVVVLFLFYGISGIAASYLVSFLFSSHATAQNIVMLANFICGFLLVLVIFFLSNLESTKEASKVLRWIFRLVPSYCLGEGIINLASRQLFVSFGVAKSPFDVDTIGYDLIYMACEFPIFFAAVLFWDHPSRNLRNEKLEWSDEMPPAIENEDQDVAEERHLVETNARPGDLVTVKNLRKVYPTPNGPKIAVKNLSFGVKHGEVFGFLGTNGAGKTTSISILCGEQLPSAGRGQIAGLDVVRDASEARMRIGYCPQFDALLDLLTPDEHMRLYAGLRGLKPSAIDGVVERLIDICDLQAHRDKPTMNLSGGNKRKLSVALSLLGGPQVVFLDEPSAGMDPMARRVMWGVIQRVARQCSVVLTTHHLEEVEVLSNRVAIMVDGELRCIGPLQRLKNKFGSGFEMSVRVQEASQVDELIQFVSAKIPTAQLQENRNMKVTFALPGDTRLSQVFAMLEESKTLLGITDYSVSQTSLESVFLRISAGAHSDE